MALYPQGEADGLEGLQESNWNATPIPLSIVNKRGDLDLQSGNEVDLWPVSQSKLHSSDRSNTLSTVNAATPVLNLVGLFILLATVRPNPNHTTRH